MHPPAPEFDEQQDVKRPQPGGLDGEEVARDDPLRLSPEELGPGRSGPPRGGTESRGPEQGADRRGSHPDPELTELAFDPHAAPPRVLPRDSEDEFTDLRIDPRPSRPTGLAVRPLLSHELAVPADGEQHPVDGPELRWAGLPPEDPELMAKDEDLEILGAIVVTRTDEETGQRPNDQA